ncbi:MAG: hypothetical protein ACI8QS_001064 [Planctomycetota bacterium]|jgi:hypothetical protein
MSLEDELLLEDGRLPELELPLGKLEERGSCETDPAERLLLELPRRGADVELGREVVGREVVGREVVGREVVGLELLGLELLGLEV